MAVLTKRKDIEKYLINYYTKVNKPKGVSIKEIKEKIEYSTLADLKDEVSLIKKVTKKSKLTKK